MVAVLAVWAAGTLGCKDDKKLLAPVCREALARGDVLLRAADVEHARDSLETARTNCGAERAADVAALEREIEVVAARRLAASASASATPSAPNAPTESLAPRFLAIAAAYKAESKRDVCNHDQRAREEYGSEACEGARDMPVPGARRVQVATMVGNVGAFRVFYSLPNERVGCSNFGATEVDAPSAQARRCVMKGGVLDGLLLLVRQADRDTDVTLYTSAWLAADPELATELKRLDASLPAGKP